MKKLSHLPVQVFENRKSGHLPCGPSDPERKDFSVVSKVKSILIPVKKSEKSRKKSQLPTNILTSIR